MKSKFEIILNVTIVVLSLLMAVLFYVGDNFFAAIGFTVIALLNCIAVVLRCFGNRKTPKDQ